MVKDYTTITLEREIKEKLVKIMREALPLFGDNALKIAFMLMIKYERDTIQFIRQLARKEFSTDQ